jgi:two-component system CheB/CheR fusion protein
MSWAPVRDGHGNVIAGEIFARDMREQAKAERSATLMMRELDHRVKNTLATVQAIAQQTLRGAASVEDFQDTFMARLMSLSKTHNLLARGGWSGTDLRELVEGELQPYQHDDEARVEIRGESVILSSKVALALSMALHELATNAAKYGALSVPDGGVAVDWETGAAKGRQHLRLRWRECRGPPVTQPKRFGFGHRLITDGLTYELDGTVALEFVATGVVCEMDIPIPPPVITG